MTLFEQMLQEASKARFITPFYDNGIADRYQQIGIPSKEEMVKFYDTHNELSSKIDWNKKKDDSFFEDLLFNMQNFSSKSTKKKNPIELFSTRKDCKIIEETENWIYVMPLTYKAGVFMDSFDCGGAGAKWCIGYEKTDYYWNSYNEHSLFILAFNKHPESKTKDLKYMIQYEQSDNYTYNFDNPDVNIWNQPDSEISNRLFSEGKFNEKFLLKLYKKALPIDEQNNSGKYYAVSYNITTTPEEAINTVSTLEVTQTKRKYPEKYETRDSRDIIIDGNEPVSISLLIKMADILNQRKLFSSRTRINVKNIVVDDTSYKNTFIKDKNLYFENILVDTIKTKDLEQFPFELRPTKDFAVKLPLNFALQCNFRKVVTKLAGCTPAAPIHAVVNSSVSQPGLSFDGFNPKARGHYQIHVVTPEEVKAGKVFYNTRLDASQLSGEDISNLRTVNSQIYKY